MIFKYYSWGKNTFICKIICIFTMYQFLSRFPQQKPQKLECVMQIGRKADRASNQGITPLRNKKSDF